MAWFEGVPPPKNTLFVTMAGAASLAMFKNVPLPLSFTNVLFTTYSWWLGLFAFTPSSMYASIDGLSVLGPCSIKLPIT